MSSTVTMRSSAIKTATDPGSVILPECHARLFRSNAPGPQNLSQIFPEQIGEGRFDKMLRLALSDPDDEVWRYSIEVSGHLVSDAIPEYGAAILRRQV